MPMKVQEEVYLPHFFALSHQFAQRLHLRKDIWSTAEEQSIVVDSHYSGTIVTHVHSVRIEHGDHFDDHITLL